MTAQQRTKNQAARDLRIHLLRSQGLTQQVIAVRIGISVTLVNKILNGHVRPRDRNV